MAVKNFAVALTLAICNKTQDEQQIKTAITYTLQGRCHEFLGGQVELLPSKSDLC